MGGEAEFKVGITVGGDFDAVLIEIEWPVGEVERGLEAVGAVEVHEGLALQGSFGVSQGDFGEAEFAAPGDERAGAVDQGEVGGVDARGGPGAGGDREGGILEGDTGAEIGRNGAGELSWNGED